MCRLAALSDDNQAAVVAEWITASRLAGYEAVSPELSRGQLQLDGPDDIFHATG
jgi:hypothetical protein